MPKNVLRVTGTYRTLHHTQRFSTEVVADDEAAAREYMLSVIGSRHGVPRRLITITKIEPVAPDDIEDPVVRFAAGLKA